MMTAAPEIFCHHIRHLAIVAMVTGCIVSFSPYSAAQTATDAKVSVASPSGTTPQNHQNEPAVAMDANNPTFLVAGSNDFVDWAPCLQSNAVNVGTCARRADLLVGLSGVYFSFDGGLSWTQPTYTGLTAADCNPNDTSPCTPHVGPIHTLPWYAESNLVSSGDPALAVGPIPANGSFSWSNGSRVYYANLVSPPSTTFPFPNPFFRGFIGEAVSRLDSPTSASIADKNSWKHPVMVNIRPSQTTFEDKEQIWADNAASSPFFGRVYLCSVQFRSVGLHFALGGNSPAPLMISVSPDGGDTWTTKQITPAGTNGLGPTEFGLSGCTIRTDSLGVAYIFAEMFENPTLVGLPTHGFHVMFKSFDGGAHWTKQQIVRQITDPCFFIDPVSGRCVTDGFAGARSDLAAAPSVDIANGAPTGAGATNEIVDAWADATPGLNSEEARVSWSTDGGTTWSTPVAVQLAGDRPIYVAPAISPTGDRVYVVYEADRDPWRGADMTSTRQYRGVFLTAAVGAGGAPGPWTLAFVGPDGDLRATYPGHDIYEERIGDYVYAAASATYGVGVWTDARNAAVCEAVQTYRAASVAAGARALPGAPWPLADCPATFGNTDIYSATTH
jgi:hypothetical protein